MWPKLNVPKLAKKLEVLSRYVDFRDVWFGPPYSFLVSPKVGIAVSELVSF